MKPEGNTNLANDSWDKNRTRKQCLEDALEVYNTNLVNDFPERTCNQEQR